VPVIKICGGKNHFFIYEIIVFYIITKVITQMKTAVIICRY